MKAALITGAATGIGEALVNKLLAQGWSVFAGYRSTAPQAASWYGKEHVMPVKCDVTDAAGLAAAAEQVSSACKGSLDLLINNAAYSGSSGVVEDPAMEEFRKTFETNFYGPINTIRAFAPMVKQARGRIINITSASVYMTIPMGAAYPVSKIALKSLTDHLRLELAPFGVEVASLAPGGVETAMTALGPDMAAAQWASIPDHLRDEYRRHFIDGSTAVGENFRFLPAPEFADKAYKQVIAAKRLKPCYIIGPGVAALPWLHRLLSTQQVLNVWNKMFAAKA